MDNIIAKREFSVKQIISGEVNISRLNLGIGMREELSWI
jgi:hypothetical protein